MIAATTLLVGQSPAQAAEKTVTAEADVALVTDAEVCAAAGNEEQCQQIGDILEATVTAEVTVDAGTDPTISIQACPDGKAGAVIVVENVSAGAEVQAHLSGTALDMSVIDETVGPVTVGAGESSVTVSVCAGADVS